MDNEKVKLADVLQIGTSSLGVIVGGGVETLGIAFVASITKPVEIIENISNSTESKFKQTLLTCATIPCMVVFEAGLGLNNLGEIIKEKSFDKMFDSTKDIFGIKESFIGKNNKGTVSGHELAYFVRKALHCTSPVQS